MVAQSSYQYPKAYLYRRIVQAKLFIDSNYHRSTNLHRIADEAFFSKFHFIRLFSQAYGATPHQYLISVRIQKAREALTSGAAVSDTCYAVGFDSVPSFTKLFKRAVGCTPGAYRAAALSRAAELTSTPLKFVPNCFAHSNGWV